MLSVPQSFIHLVVPTNNNFSYGNTSLRGAIKIENKVAWPGYLSKSIPYTNVQATLETPLTPILIPAPVPYDQVQPLINVYEIEQDKIRQIFDQIDITRMRSNKASRVNKNDSNSAYTYEFIVDIAIQLGIPRNNSKETLVNSIQEYYRNFIMNKDY